MLRIHLPCRALSRALVAAVGLLEKDESFFWGESVEGAIEDQVENSLQFHRLVQHAMNVIEQMEPLGLAT